LLIVFITSGSVTIYSGQEMAWPPLHNSEDWTVP